MFMHVPVWVCTCNKLSLVQATVLLCNTGQNMCGLYYHLPVITCTNMHKAGLSNQFCPSVSLSVQKTLKMTLSNHVNAFTGVHTQHKHSTCYWDISLPDTSQGGSLFSATSYKYYHFISSPLSKLHMLVAMHPFLIDILLCHA